MFTHNYFNITCFLILHGNSNKRDTLKSNKIYNRDNVIPDTVCNHLVPLFQVKQEKQQPMKIWFPSIEQLIH